MLKAFDARDSRGRRDEYDEDLLVHDLDIFTADELKILQSKAYRRLASKTQVLCFPSNPHIRTRSVHTNEVIAISTTISELLGLNTPLCRAIAAGHDIGHTPYGHVGEKILSELGNKDKKFEHQVYSVVVAQDIERKGLGLNLTYETLEGILLHSRGDKELKTEDNKPQEYAVVMYSDKIAYTFSDLNDAIRWGFLTEKDIPSAVNRLGKTQRRRNDNCIKALIRESREKGYVSFSEGKEFEIFNELKAFMYDKVYYKVNWDVHKAVLKQAYNIFSEEFQDIDPIIILSLLTDREVNKLGILLLGTKIELREQIKNFGVFEITPYLKGKKIDYSNSDLSWGK
ncbi:HD domain-containing protein [Candidatus Woesearchaeota archaeon]|nr:HD domain-containing protein [Candidatus Woesearchaeota archaeon]